MRGIILINPIAHAAALSCNTRGIVSNRVVLVASRGLPVCAPRWWMARGCSSACAHPVATRQADGSRSPQQGVSDHKCDHVATTELALLQTDEVLYVFQGHNFIGHPCSSLVPVPCSWLSSLFYVSSISDGLILARRNVRNRRRKPQHAPGEVTE
jgi:hypothetical protein